MVCSFHKHPGSQGPSSSVMVTAAAQDQGPCLTGRTYQIATGWTNGTSVVCHMYVKTQAWKGGKRGVGENKTNVQSSEVILCCRSETHWADWASDRRLEGGDGKVWERR